MEDLLAIEAIDESLQLLINFTIQAWHSKKLQPDTKLVIADCFRAFQEIYIQLHSITENLRLEAEVYEDDN